MNFRFSGKKKAAKKNYEKRKKIHRQMQSKNANSGSPYHLIQASSETWEVTENVYEKDRHNMQQLKEFQKF